MPKREFSSIRELKEARLNGLRHRLGQVWRVAPPEAWQSLERLDHAFAKTQHLIYIEHHHRRTDELGNIVHDLDAVVKRLEEQPLEPLDAIECLKLTQLIDRIDLVEGQ